MSPVDSNVPSTPVSFYVVFDTQHVNFFMVVSLSVYVGELH